MKIICAKDYSDLSRKAANIISAQVILKPESVLGLATGSTPIGIYRQLISWYEKGDVDFSKAVSINLDEYCGLSPRDPQSYSCFMHQNFFDHINIDKKNTFVASGMGDFEANARELEEKVREGGAADLQLLGIGNNGHIAFNEPCEEFPEKTHVVDLTQNTIEANARFFESMDQVPKKALTMGIGTIMKAKKIVLLANGPKKAQTIYDTVYGPITPKVPASVLRLHPDVTIFVDEEAGALLKK